MAIQCFNNFSKWTVFLFFNFILKISTLSNCGSFVAEGVTACTSYSTNDTLCCYLRTFTNKYWSSICYPINATDYLSLNGKIQLGDYLYSIDCGDTIGTTCGQIMRPVSYKDCSQYSLSDNSCCYYMYKGDTSCIWLGTGDTGEIEQNGLHLICSGRLIKSFDILYLLLFLSILIYY